MRKTNSLQYMLGKTSHKKVLKPNRLKCTIYQGPHQGTDAGCRAYLKIKADIQQTLIRR